MSSEQTVNTLRRIQNLESLDLQNAGLKNIDELLNDWQNLKNKSISLIIESHEDWDQTAYQSDIIEPSFERMSDFT